MSTSKKVLIGLGSVVGFIVLLVGLGFYLLRGLTTPIYNQLDAIKQGDMVKAYSYTSESFQKATSLSEFKHIVTSFPAIYDNKERSFYERAVTNNIGTVKGTLTSSKGGSIHIEYQLIKENGEWKINYFEIPSAGIAIENEPTSFDEKKF
jgi:hypothetical protein